MLALWVHAPPALAVDNAALGGIRGTNNGTLEGGDGTGRARISLIPVDLALIKQARELTGAVLPDGATVAAGRTLWFVLYVDNPTAAPAADVRVEDLLDESQFTYLPGTLEQTLVSAGSTDAAIWAGTWIPLSDDLGPPDDAASAIDNGGPPGFDRITAGAQAAQANVTVNVPAGVLWALRFQVRVN